ncbi:MAG: hypothetical protein VX403_00200 [Planctomycetota bacterium]|nr:hypothetical protein [Planctomycetota bacterium]MEC9232310.1 hypothetical protein [Planctomycetota bacterium]
MNRCPAKVPACTPLATLLLAAISFIGLQGCVPYATYPPDGHGPNVYPWIAPCPEVMATALKSAHERVAPDVPFIYNLPKGASRKAWKDVQSRLGPRARRMIEGDTVVWDLERFGIRNTKAFADILYWNDGRSILLTVSLERDNIMPFRLSHIQRFYLKAKSMPVDNYPLPGQDQDQDQVEEGGAVVEETEVTVETDAGQGAEQ